MIKMGKTTDKILCKDLTKSYLKRTNYQTSPLSGRAQQAVKSERVRVAQGYCRED